MYNYGLIKFLQAKKLKPADCINLFLKEEGIAQFSAKHHNRVNNYIQNNWSKFASFCDQAIKSGRLKGNDVKLNSYFSEQKERRITVSEEFRRASLSKEQKDIIQHIKENGIGEIQSFLMKKGVQPLPKDLSFIGKSLKWMPLINQAIENNFNLNKQNENK